MSKGFTLSAANRRTFVIAALVASTFALPAAAAPVRVDFQGAVSPLVPDGDTRPNNVFGVNGSDTYTGYVEFELDVLTDRVMNSPLATNADGRAVAVQFSPQDDPSIKFSFSIGGQERFTHQDLDPANDPLLTFAVSATINRIDPDGPGPERPFDVVTYGRLDEFFLVGVNLLSNPITVSSSSFRLAFLNEPDVVCITRRGTSNQDCLIRAGTVSGEIADDVNGLTEVGLDVLAQTSGAGTIVPIPQTDSDNDGVLDFLDNCPQVPNSNQTNTDGDGAGDACDADDDNDGLTDQEEQPLGTNPLLADTDNDGLFDGVEVQTYGTNPLVPDTDGDGPVDGADNCPLNFNTDQTNTDGDSAGDVCDTDDDNDGLTDQVELQLGTNPLVADTDGDGPNDGADNCPLVPNANQTDTDGDGAGDACDADDDNDGLSDQQEQQFGTNPLVADTDGDGVSDGEEVQSGRNPTVNEPAVIAIILGTILLD